MEYTKGEEKFFFMIQKGYEYENLYHDLHKACEYYGEARACLERLYGRDNRLCNIVNLYDYVWENYQEDYRTAILKLADVGEMLEDFSEQDSVDEFTAWINENKASLLNEVIGKTLNVLQHFDLKFSLEDILMQSVFTRNDMEEVINRTLIDPLGLPRKFHYLLQQMLKDTKDITPDMKYKAMELYDFMRNQQGKDYSNMKNEEKIQLVKSLYDLMQESGYHYMENGTLGGGISSFVASSRGSIDFAIVRGMMGLGETDFAESLLLKLKGDYDFDDIDSQIKIKLVECLLNDKKGNKKDAEKILDEIIDLENSIIMQVFFMDNEQRKIEFLKGIEYLMKRTAEVCNQICGALAAYSMVVRTRTLSFDHSSIHLSSDEHRHVVLKGQQLKLREKAGEDVTAEYNKLMDYFEKASHGIFEFDSTHICRKLTDKQAILEFTILTDERDCDFYYVFVVTSKAISAINLGKSTEVNECIDEILKYISNYSASKHSKYQIRMLSQYYDLYKMILLPIGEVLPQSIHNLLISGAGNFLEIPFGLLPCFHWYDKFMEDEYHISYINSGKELLRDTNYVMNQGAVVIGNPDFEGKFPALPSSEKETQVIAKMLKVKPITGREAVPECLKKSVGIFHISTHSYSEKETDSNKDIDPMKRIGLVFAGGQLLSAKEISQMDMSKTDLVVLSVCGVKEEKGVFSDIGPGIRRAFINAGARHIILNLWKTDDNAAELLMRCFYDYYIQEKKSIEESLRIAKHYLRTSSVGKIKREKYYDASMEQVFTFMEEDEIPYAHPYYWAGFIVLGV